MVAATSHYGYVYKLRRTKVNIYIASTTLTKDITSSDALSTTSHMEKTGSKI